MHKLIISLLVVLVFVSCQTQEDERSKYRGTLANLVGTSKDAIDAKWESPELLVVTVKQGSLKDKVKGKNPEGKDIYLDAAKLKAATFASFGAKKIGMPICIKVVYPDGQERAYQCSTDPPLASQ